MAEDEGSRISETVLNVYQTVRRHIKYDSVIVVTSVRTSDQQINAVASCALDFSGGLTAAFFPSSGLTTC
jgi:ribosomal protein L18E